MMKRYKFFKPVKNMKKIFTLIILIPMMAANAYAQSATAGIGDYQEEPGSVQIPVEVTGFTDLGAISIYFEYDPAVLTYTGYSDPALSGMLANAFNLNGVQQVGISWSGSGMPGSDVPDGNLITINFEYITGSCNLSFLESNCEIADYEGNLIPTLYMDGSISPVNYAHIALPDVTETPNTSINVPMDVDFSEITDGVSSFNFVIDFDPGALDYTSITNVALTNVTVQEVSASRISIGWLNPDETGSSLNGKLLDITFAYGIGDSDLTFVEALSAVGDNNGLDVNADYTSGSVTQDPATIALVTIAQREETPGTQIEIPVDVIFLGVPDGISSFTLVIDFDETVVQYLGINDAALTPIDIDIISASRVAFSWLNEGTTGSNHKGKLLDLEFDFTGGYSDLTFDTELCEMGDNNALDVNATYTDGWVTQDPETIVQVIAGTLDEVTAGTTVEVPVTVQNFSNIGSFNLYILFDPAVLSSAAVINLNGDINPNDLIYNVINNNKLGINWNGQEVALNLADDEKLFDLQFSFASGESDLQFVTGECEISDINVNTLYSEYTDGLVSEFAPLDISVAAAEVLAQPGDVEVPVTAQSFDNIGAFDFVISFDDTKLTFNSLINQLAVLNSDGDLQYNLSGNQIFIGWNLDASATSGLDIDDDEKLFDLSFNYLGGESDVAFEQESCEVSDFDLQVLDVSYQSGSVRGGIQVDLTLFLEGLYNTGTGEMNKAKDYDADLSQTVDMYDGNIADLIDVELHASGNYGTPVYTAENVELMQDGTASFDIPADYSGEYYVTVKHRNHLETVSANPVSFANLEVSYDFTSAETQAYGNAIQNELMIELEPGRWGIWAGDVFVDREVNFFDISSVLDVLRSENNNGYIVTDINGDGSVNFFDLSKAIDNQRLGVSSTTP